jgi:hypothetical protein
MTSISAGQTGSRHGNFTELLRIRRPPASCRNADPPKTIEEGRRTPDGTMETRFRVVATASVRNWHLTNARVEERACDTGCMIALSAMVKSLAHRERRAADRPADGDVVRCPTCHQDTLEFNARWRVPLDTGEHISAPAWLCENADCRSFRFARESDRADDASRRLRRTSPDARGRGGRMLKASLVRQRPSRAGPRKKKAE